MKIAISDACIFIDLLDLGLIIPFFEQGFEIHTSSNVMNELNTEQQKKLEVFKTDKKLIVHPISEADTIEINSIKYPSSLSLSDKTILFLAEKLNAIVLSSDKAVRRNAKNRCIEYHGMLWILDQLIEYTLISKKDGITKLNQLVMHNQVYQNNKDLMKEIAMRITKWS